MKKLLIGFCILLTLICLPFLGISQDCSNFIETTNDKVTGKTSTTSKFLHLKDAQSGSEMLIYSYLYNKYNLYISYRLEGVSGCVDHGNKINILFKDGSRLELENMKEFNCEGDGMVLFAKMSPLMKRFKELQSKDIDVIRVYSNKSYFEASLTPDQANQFRQGLLCLMPTKK